MAASELIPSVAIPEMRVGKTTVTGKGWVEIPFEYTFHEPPSVVCVAEQRLGIARPSEFTAPKFDLPSLLLPDISLPLITNKVKNEVERRMRDKWGLIQQASLPILFLNPLGVGLLYWLFEAFLLPMAIEQAVGSIKIIDNEIITPINTHFAKVRSDINEFSGNLRVKAQDSLNTLSAQATNALNLSIDLLWDTLGLEKGTLINPISIRNVTPKSFEVNALGVPTSLGGGGGDSGGNGGSGSGSGSGGSGDDTGGGQYGYSRPPMFVGEGDGTTTFHWIAISGVSIETPLITLPEWLQPK